MFIRSCEKNLSLGVLTVFQYSWKNCLSITNKCLPILLYGLEVCPLSKSDLQSHEFVVNRFLMKLFTKTSNNDILSYCRYVLLPTKRIAGKRHNKCVPKLSNQ